MADELNSGVAYLMSLKHGAEPHARGAAQTEHSVTEHPRVEGERFQGAEKRRSPRYKCEGSAEMREEGCDVRTWATFTDISLNGCYVEAQATYPVGTVLHLKIEANGISLQTTGTVRVNYPHLGMGIAFTEISDEKRAKLKELLGTLAHHTLVMARGTSQPVPALENFSTVSDPAAALRALGEFFETHVMMSREDFARILRKSQTGVSTH